MAQPALKLSAASRHGDRPFNGQSDRSAGRRAWAQPVTYLGLAMLAAIYGILTFLIVADRKEAVATAIRQSENLVRIIDESYSHTFQSIDSSLLFLRKVYDLNPYSFDIADWVQAASIRTDLTFNYVITDAAGRIRHATRPEAAFTQINVIGLSLADRDYFRNQAETKNDALYISAPLTLRATGTQALVLTRRIVNQSGKFVGIVAALVDPNELGRGPAGIDLGRDGTFGLIGLDGVVRTRVINGKIDTAMTARKFPVDADPLAKMIGSGSGQFWNLPGTVDNITRLVSYRVLDAFPMIATVTLTEDEVYRRSHAAERIYLLIALFLTGGILAAIRWGIVRERKLLAATSALRESQERYSLVEAAVNDGIWDWDILSGRDYRSVRWKRILGYTDEELPNCVDGLRTLLHPDDRENVVKAIHDHLEDNKPYDREFRLLHKDGEYRWLHSRGKAVRDADGRPVRMLGSITDITERKMTERAMEESRANLSRAETMVGLGHYKFTKGSPSVTWSDGNYRIMGKSPDTFIPTVEAVIDAFHPQDRPALLEHRRAVLTGETPSPVTLRAIRDDGEIALIHCWSTPLRAADGSTIGYFGTAQDVTERYRKDAALKESRDNLARAEVMVHMGHFKFDLASGEYLWSDGLYEIMHETPDTFKPTLDSVLELLHPDDKEALRSYRADTMAGTERAPVTVRILRRDGSVMIVEIWSAPIRAADGTVAGMFGTIRDVTARKQAEAQIAESHANLERAERLALLGHYKIDRLTSELVWSDGIYRVFGLSRDTFTPTLRNALELVHPDDRHLIKKFRDQAMAGHEVPHATVRAFRSDGAEIEIEYWSTPVRDHSGVITGIFGTVQDITLRKQAESALARANTELEMRVSERTAELAEEMRRREQAQSTLAQMQKMEVVGQLTAGIAHDFNNLLAVIGGSLEFVDGAAARGLTAEPELIDAALRATRRGRELVRRLLAFSRQSPLRSEPTAIDQLVLDTLRLLRRTLGQSIDMVTHLDAKAAVISVDRNQMANALLNLALNARDAMPEGGQLTISTRIQNAAAEGAANGTAGETVCIVIRDTGIGMTKEVRERAFEPFFTTKPDGLGSGLGLSMVQGFVEQSGGQIEIESGENGGTTFIIKLPRIASISQDDEADPVTGLTVQAREKTVLLVEDDPDVRVVTAAQLKQLGYKVHAVSDGSEAIDLIASPATIDITLTDIVLPGGLDGVELIKEAMRARPKMGVLCMSGYDPAQKHRKWLKIQNINFLEKPFSSSRLAQALHEALAH